MGIAYIKRDKTGRINIKIGNKVDYTLKAILWSLGIVTVAAFLFFDYTGFQLTSALKETMTN